MTETAMCSDSQKPLSTFDPIDHLPLRLLRSDIVPPAPTRSQSIIDWLPDFARHTWVAYGAASLLVISHFPSPFSSEQTLMGPIFRQVFDLCSGDTSTVVSAVSWSPQTPSFGEIAAAVGNRIWVLSHDSATTTGSFCWSQNAVLVQSKNVDAIAWTVSGDGIISGGTEVVLWRKSNKHWEIAWKFKADQPQTLASATWSIEGTSATVAHSNTDHVTGSSTEEVSKLVLVYQRDGKSGYSNSELRHPLPVSMIQWRPIKLGNRDVRKSARNVLLTCCLDGSVRLWSEIEVGKARKNVKDGYEPKNLRHSFHVVAVIEINQTLSGALGSDIFVTWGFEIGGFFRTGEHSNDLLFNENQYHDEPAKCEWLVAFGPGTSVNFWAIHCLNDTFPFRFPRVTMWKRDELLDQEVGVLHRIGASNFKDTILLNKVILWRSSMSGPPVLCSPVHLLPNNILVWSGIQIGRPHVTIDSDKKSSAGNCFSHVNSGCLTLDGHTGKIVEISIHPSICEVEVAASLDSNGLVLFWSLSTISNFISGHPSLVPSWVICGKLAARDSRAKYTSLNWAPSLLGRELFLLMGHASGIDCLIVLICQNEANLQCHYLCTIPFSGHGPYEDGPDGVYTIPMQSTCNGTFLCNRFMLLGLWMGRFQALSWEISLHSFDSFGSCSECNLPENFADGRILTFESTVFGKKYYVAVIPSAFQLPHSHIHDQVTSFAVVCPSHLVATKHNGSANNLCNIYPAYTMATGCSDGILKLWRNNSANPSTPCIQWELVGMVPSVEGPVNGISLASCGQKIATLCKTTKTSPMSMIHIWDSVNLSSEGTFLLEDTLTFDRNVVSFNWLDLGTGQLLLGVCTQNELHVHIHTQSRYVYQSLSNPKNSQSTKIWSCIALVNTSSPICKFFWGPRGTAIAVHGSYFSIFSNWLVLTKKELATSSCKHKLKEDDLHCDGRRNKGIFSGFFVDYDVDNSSKLSPEDCLSNCKSMMSFHTDPVNAHLESGLFADKVHQRTTFSDKIGLWSILELVEKLSGPLPLYHPMVLLMNINSGNWKRAYRALKHLLEYLRTNYLTDKNHGSRKSTLPSILLSDYLEGTVPKRYTEKGSRWSGDTNLISSSQESQNGLVQFSYNLGSASASNSMLSSTGSELNGFIESLGKWSDLDALIDVEKSQIQAIIDLLGEVSSPNSSSPYHSLDELGRRFWVALRFQQLDFRHKNGIIASVDDLLVDSRMVVWAYHSDCHEELFGSILPNDPSWQEMRTLGIGFWFTNVSQLRPKMEKLARSQYLKNKTPRDCALLYVVLNRLQVLTGLFKVSKDEKDKPLVGFLSRNFQDEKNKAAALKNAYILLGKHQLELAIAFFLLGGENTSAVNVCAKNLGDEQLALVICRLVEGRGGPLECHLIKKHILPSTIDKGDYWLASLLEWELGNYYQSFTSMLNLSVDPVEKSVLMSNHVSFLDPNIGLFCQTLASMNCMKNAIGEQNAAILSRWATVMAATAFKRSGLIIEAMECYSSLNVLGISDQVRTLGHDNFTNLHSFLKPSPRNSCSWLLGDVAVALEFQARSNLALEYISKFIIEHPRSLDGYDGALGHATNCDEYTIQYQQSLEKFKVELHNALILFEQKYFLASSNLINKILVSLCHHDLLFIGYSIDIAQSNLLPEVGNSSPDMLFLHRSCHKMLLDAAEEVFLLCSKYISACSISCSQLIFQSFLTEDPSHEDRCKCLDTWQCQFQCLLVSLRHIRASLRIVTGSSTDNRITKPIMILDLLEYCLYFSSAWLQKNSKALLAIMQTFLISISDGKNLNEVEMVNMMKLLPKISSELMQDPLVCALEVLNLYDGAPDKHCDIKYSVPIDERWNVLGACLWQQMAEFSLNKLSDTMDGSDSSSVFWGKPFPKVSRSVNLCSNDIDLSEEIRLVLLSLCRLLKMTLGLVSSHHLHNLSFFLWWKLENCSNVVALKWLKESGELEAKSLILGNNLNVLDFENKDGYLASEKMWELFADPKLIFDGFAQEKINWSKIFHCKCAKGWNDMNRYITGLDETEANSNDKVVSSSSDSHDNGSPVKGLFLNNSNHSPKPHQKDLGFASRMPFTNPKEIYKRNGELLEALCLNSIDQQQAAVTSNRKGIVFFHYEDGVHYNSGSDHIWCVADWPQNGWAGSLSTPAPTYVSPGVGLGCKKGAHLGLGGATVGVSSSRSPSRDFGDRAFGIPDPSGSGAALGWEVQQEFEKLVDPTATVENISTRALFRHPLRPFFLVGSSNTQIYLWEFGKDKATATYGVLPAANIPPPYSLASISALHFDHWGHRFASAASDGTICTWQLEVGGRSNICPTESALCFHGHASDISYFSSSGSIVAAAGHSSNGINVVIWDTLAPPTTSRASIICHEGGARSLSVIENEVGSGSVSPIIVTGGKEGDVGVHDFRYVATGRSKRNRRADIVDQSSSTDINSEDQNRNGMLWHIPKAHAGSITKISSIPNTSLFLTGSKDGDVKLWDAKKAKLVYHWSKLHERHTFLQPSSRGFGGILRAAVTDIQVISHGFLTCGGDGTVRLVQLKDYKEGRDDD